MQKDISEILKRVQQIQIVANRSVDEIFAGQYKSVFRGRGMEFDEVREYQPGDDIRTIDWNVTAREGRPYIKRFVEERELTIMFLVDISASGVFGSPGRSKLDMMIEVAALLMFSALKNNDKVGLMTFCDDVVDYFPPRKGKGNVLHLIRELVGVGPIQKETRLDRALEFISRVRKRRAVCFLMSDFLAPYASHAMSVCAKRHDLIAVTTSDPREFDLPDVGFITLEDAETGALVEVDTRHPEVRSMFHRKSLERDDRLASNLRRSGVDRLAIRTDEDYLTSLRRFFHMREKRFR